jgi:hypothetical protein
MPVVAMLARSDAVDVHPNPHRGAAGVAQDHALEWWYIIVVTAAGRAAWRGRTGRCGGSRPRDAAQSWSATPRGGSPWPSRRRTVLGCDRTAPSTGRRRPAPDRTPTRTAAADRIVGSGRPREGNRRGRTPLRAPDLPVGPAAVRSRAAGPTLLDGHDRSLRTRYASGAACGGPHDNRLVSREGSRWPDAVIQASARKADEEAIPVGMDDEDDAASGSLGAASDLHTSLARHWCSLWSAEATRTPLPRRPSTRCPSTRPRRAWPQVLEAQSG